MATNKLFSHLLVAFLCLFSIQFLIAESRILKSDSHTFKSLLQSLKKVEKGQTAVGIDEVKKYLKKFGYYPNTYTNINLSNDFDDLLETALKKYQMYYGLQVSGKLDSDTVKQLTIPRCGFPDIIPNITSSKSRLFRTVPNYEFPPGMPVWSKSELTYTFDSGVEDPNEQDLVSVSSRAFRSWADVSALSFREASNGDETADIVIGFYRGSHGDGDPFDGPGQVLAHGFFPEDGRLHLDADENWSTDPSEDAIDLESVALHEIGHVLGLAHSQDPNAVMYASYEGPKRDLTQDDIDGIQELYQ